MKIKVAKIRVKRIGVCRPSRETITDFHTVDYFKTDYFGYDLDTGRSYMYEKVLRRSLLMKRLRLLIHLFQI